MGHLGTTIAIIGFDNNISTSSTGFLTTRNDFVATAGQTDYTCTKAINLSNIQVFIDGVMTDPKQLVIVSTYVVRIPLGSTIYGGETVTIIQ